MSSPFYLIAGLGKTGLSIARYLRRRNVLFAVFDTRLEPAGMDDFYAEFPDVTVYLNDFPVSGYAALTGIISSPGIALDTPLMQRAMAHDIPVFGDIECLAREVLAPIVAITGTNGKSTVTTLVGEMAKAAGISVAVAGNIGTPVLDLLDDGTSYDLWVLELSSFQLDLVTSLSPIAATILNVTPDHLDRHHSLDAYRASKQRVYHRAKTRLYNREDSQSYPQSNDPQSVLVSFGEDEPVSANWGLIETDGVVYLAYGQTRLLPVNELRIKGSHNWANALAACALAHAVGISFDDMIGVLKRFSGLPHRSQWVRTMDGVDWINDSKGTNIGATISAISGIGGAMQGKIVLIAGGQGKGADFTTLRFALTDYVRSMVLLGEDADLMEKALVDVVPIVRASNLDEAVLLAKAQSQPGDVVLLSPACASLDMFRDFNHRGDVFTAKVNAL